LGLNDKLKRYTKIQKIGELELTTFENESYIEAMKSKLIMYAKIGNKVSKLESSGFESP